MKYLVLTLLVLIATLSYSQTTYPRKIILDGDTLVAVTIEQMKVINKTFIHDSYQQIVVDSLGEQIVLLNAKIENNQLIYENQKIQIDNLDQIINNQQLINNRLEENLNQTLSELKVQRRKRVIVQLGLSISTVINIVLGTLLIVK